MFRPTMPPSRMAQLPTWLAVGVCALSVVLFAAAAFVGVQWERSRALEVWIGQTPAIAFGLRWADLVRLALAVLGIAAVGIVITTALVNHHASVQTLQRMKGLVRNILESIPTGVLTLDRFGAVTSLNGAAERLLGLRATAVTGRPVGTLDTAPDLVRWIETSRAGARLVEEADLGLDLEGGRRATVRASAAELRDDAGRADGLVILLRDVTEVSRLETQLRRTDKLAALGTLAAGVAHEVRNPLHALTLNLHLLDQELAAGRGSSSDAGEYVGILRAEIQRIHRIVDNFLRFAKPSIPETKPLDVHALLERVFSLLAFEAAERRVTIETVFDPALPSVPGDEGQLSQVFLNLGMNALQAMADGGSLVVATARDVTWARVSVSDTGDGIAAETLPHLFDPYFTTRPRGVGLGLAIAHRIVEGHRGTIDVESEVGRGTTMTVRLPVDHGA